MKATLTLSVCILAALVGCSADPVSTHKTNNNGIVVEDLFTDKQGFTVHRFSDNGRSHYYVTPAGSVTAQQATVVSTGKVTTTHVHDETIQTLPTNPLSIGKR